MIGRRHGRRPLEGGPVPINVDARPRSGCPRGSAPLRVILSVNYSPWSMYCGGGQRATHALALALSALGHRVTAVYTKALWERITVPDGLPYTVCWSPFIGLRSRGAAPLRPLNALPMARTVARLVEPEQATVVHAQGEEGALLARLKPRFHGAMRCVLTAHYPQYPNARRARVWPKFRALHRAAHGADLCCVPSAASRKAFATAVGIEAAAVRVVPNGLDPIFARIRRAPDAASGPLIYFGRIDSDKGVLVLIEALSRLGFETPPLLIVGRGPLEGAVRARAAALGLGERVRLIGWKEPAELAALLASARLAVLPSLAESFGLAMVEAMAAGVPLVTTRAGAVPEVVGDPPGARMVPPGDTPALARAIKQLLDNPEAAEHLGRAGRLRAKHYSWEATARTYEGHYHGLWGG